MKVHFAGGESMKDIDKQMQSIGVGYRLNSFYYIGNGKWKDPETVKKYKHVIIDSGLFTMMFGAESHIELTEASLFEYKEAYIKFIKALPQKNFSFVELDVQKKLSVELAWEYRKEFKARLPKRHIMNVYHLEDKNPDKLIDFSDYIAISLPELKNELSAKDRMSVTNYIVNKAQAKGKMVHILGMSGKDYMSMFKRCDTCDSTNWIWFARSKSYKEHLLQSSGINATSEQSRTLSGQQEIRLAISTSLNLYNKYAGSQI